MSNGVVVVVNVMKEIVVVVVVVAVMIVDEVMANGSGYGGVSEAVADGGVGDS